MCLKRRFKLHSLQILVIGFALLIFTGGVLLSLPIANKGEPISFLDAVFTAASATCVTGLAIFDTYSQFSLFGQAVLLLLIQIGGLGFMTVAILFSMVIGRRISLRERSLLMESVSTWKIGGIVRLTQRVLMGTAIIELGGAIILATRFCPEFGFWQGLWFGVFHSVSAFCNAGFDLMGIRAPGTSLAIFRGDIVVNATIMCLIIVGGIGFLLWEDIAEKKFKFSKYQLHTKIMVSATAFLIIVPAVVFFFSEKDAAFAGMPIGERALAALFQSVTPRTAGFCTVPLATLSEGGSLLTMILMVIGAGPGSTGGGVKVTTVMVLLLAIVANIRGREDLDIFNRRLEPDVLRRASSAVVFYIMQSMLACFVLCCQGFSLKDSLFETISAIGTVGLSNGITAALPVLSKLAIIALMYSGRLGSLSVAMALQKHGRIAPVRNTIEKIIV